MSTEDSSSCDEEIFFGKLSLKEIRKHLFIEKHDAHRQSIGCDTTIFQQNCKEKSFTMIEAQSEPDLMQLNDSFYNEKTSEQKYSNKKITSSDLSTNLTKPCVDIEKYDDKEITPQKSENNNKSNILGRPEPLSYFTPLKENKKDIKEAELFSTPLSEKKLKVPVFKTPAMPRPASHTKASLKKTPLKSNAYQHITSPIASYINESPRAPLLKDIRPMKPLPGPSSIPKIVKSASKSNLGSKENIFLPPVAYKCAKKMHMIDTSTENKKTVSSLPRPLVIKHSHRENVKKVLPSQQEDSFADLSLHQADLSVCTKKSAFIKPNIKKA